MSPISILIGEKVDTVPIQPLPAWLADWRDPERGLVLLQSSAALSGPLKVLYIHFFSGVIIPLMILHAVKHFN